jgi:hypothetical protein
MCRKNLMAAVAIGAALLFGGLSCERAAVAPQGTATLEIYLTDAPAPFREVWIDVEKIMVTVSSDSPSDSGWMEVPLTRAGAYNLSGFTHGQDTLVASQKLPQGNISEMRLLLGSDNYLVMNDGSMAGLSLPSSVRDGMDIPVQAKLGPSGTVRLVLDIDAAASVISTPSGYQLSPAVRTYEKGSAGELEGVVLPDSAVAGIRAIAGGDTTATLPDSTGYFLFTGLKPGSYQVIFGTDSASGYRGDTLFNAGVEAARRLTLDTVWLPPAGDSLDIR